MATPTVYIVADFRTVFDTSTGTYAVLPNITQHQSRNGAEERYHTALAAAARSDQYPCYSAFMMTNDGFVLESKHYEHEVNPVQPEQSE